MGQTQRSRLKDRLRRLTAAELVERARERADVTRYRAHSSTSERLRTELVDAGDTAHRLGLADSAGVDGYLAAGEVDSVVSRHGLIRDDEGQVTLRATRMGLDVVDDLSRRSVVLAALDLAESLNVRERRAGRDAPEDALEELRG